MNKRSVIIISSLLICFVIALCCGLAFTQITPDKGTVTHKYEKAGYECKISEYQDYSMRTFTKGDDSVIVIWFGDDDNLATKTFATINKFKGKKFAIRRGNAIALGFEKDIKIFQFA